MVRTFPVEAGYNFFIMKIYRITCKTDPYHASRSRRYEGCEILKYDGATPVKWVHDDNCGNGYTLEEARRELDLYYHEDTATCSAKDAGVSRKHFENFYRSDIWTYEIEEFLPK